MQVLVGRMDAGGEGEILVLDQGIKTVDSQSGIPAAMTPIKRYRLMLSDGKSSFSGQ